ncbi:replication origin binding protein [Lithospermum erythrorhizon]|uniref:Origin of replication complex subunit 6 n=1 Tax=Lithospermum erythrorhizon TaxID=34254 RepID=A0AAV3RJ63_LITER
MDISSIAKKLGLNNIESEELIRKATEFRRLADTQFNSSAIGIGEICKAVICMDIAANWMDEMIDRKMAIRLSGMSEKAYIRSFNSMQNAIGVKNNVDVREFAIRFGCIRIIPLVNKGIALYKERFLASLPVSRRSSTDFTRPVFTAVAFYLCAKRHKLKVDKIKLIELCGTSESEFSSVSASMNDICFDVFGISREKKVTKAVKGNRGLTEKSLDEGYSSDDEKTSPSKKRKREEEDSYEDWKATVLDSNKNNIKVQDKQVRLDVFLKQKMKLRERAKAST